MIKGKGTSADPLYTTSLRLMDMDIMARDDETHRAVFIFEDRIEDQLYAASLSIDDLREIIRRGEELLVRYEE